MIAQLLIVVEEFSSNKGRLHYHSLHAFAYSWEIGRQKVDFIVHLASSWGPRLGVPFPSGQDLLGRLHKLSHLVHQDLKLCLGDSSN